MSDVKDVLTKARDYLAEHGWCRGTGAVRNVVGDVVDCCALGALWYGNGFERIEGLGPWEMQAAEAELRHVMGRPITKFNDLVAKDKAEVLAMFDQAIERAA